MESRIELDEEQAVTMDIQQSAHGADQKAPAAGVGDSSSEGAIDMKSKLKQSKYRVNGEEVTVTHGSGNVFADLGLPDADDLLAKAKLAIHIERTIKARNLTQAKAAQLLGLDQPKVSSIINGRLEGFSTDRLMRFLNDLGCDVKITISPPHPKSRGHVMFA